MCSYSFIDNGGKKRVARATKFGTDFQIEAINACLKDIEKLRLKNVRNKKSLNASNKSLNLRLGYEEMRHTVPERPKNRFLNNCTEN